MPMKWDVAADANLFHNVLKIHNVKLDYDALAKAMGPECTAKAIMHRIAGLRATAKKPVTSPDGLSPASSPAKSPATEKTTAVSPTKSPSKNTIPRKPITAKKNVAAAHKGSKKRTVDEISTEEEEEDDEGMKREPQNAWGRAKMTPKGKKVKVEGGQVVEDEGEEEQGVLAKSEEAILEQNFA